MLNIIFIPILLFGVAVSSNAEELDWWQKTVFYQIYPRSFKDSDGDGVGDLRGVTQNLDHFVDAGINAIWLSPIFKSPMVDFGYDISDFREIHHEYGTMQDFEDLVAKSKSLGLKVILDFVPNHTSNESDYFTLSVNRTAGYEDFLIWDDGLPNPDPSIKTRLPPSNWVSQFQGSAWEWNEQRQQFYLHQFAIQQPDLNYRNPIVVEEMISVLRFWLDKGVDGFRMDAMPYLMEARKEDYGGRYPDDPLTNIPGILPDELGYTIPLYTKDLPELYDLVYEWRKLLDSYKDKDGETRVMLTEGYANLTNTMKYYGNLSHPISMVPFNFDFITNVNKKSNARDIVYTALRWLTYIPKGKSPNWVFGNHDNSRMATRFGSHLVDAINMLDMLLPGVAITYQGDEIGMEDAFISYEETVDVSGCNAGPNRYQEFSRDPARTPFQWDDSKNAGFSNATKTWLPVAENYQILNLEIQKKSSRSHYSVYKLLTALRNSKVLQNGDWNIKPLTDQTFVLIRSLTGYKSICMVANMGPNEETVDISMFKELSPNLNVKIRSIDSSRKPGDIDKTLSITLVAGESIVYESN